MKLYFMKQNALEFMKQNINELYTHYFTDDTCDWINEAYGEEAFSIFKEVSDFELSDLDEKKPGEIDFINIQTMYLALQDLSASQASDERLWAGLCNKVFYSYLRRRWKYDEKDITDAVKDASAILSRFFFSGGSRGSYFRNSVAKYWWVGKLTYDKENEKDKFYSLKVIGSSDLNSKITEIFYNNTFTSNPIILRGIINALKVFYEKNIIISEREVLRPTMQYLNAIGGALLLDALPREEITKLTVNKIKSLLERSFSALKVLNEEEGDKKEFEIPNSISIPDNVVDLVYDFEGEKDIFVEKGNRVVVYIEDINKESIFNIPSNKGKNEMTLINTLLLGKYVGDIVKIAKHKYIIKEIIKF